MKTFLVLFVIFFSSMLYADWRFSSSDHGLRYYYDSKDIKKKGKYVNTWILIDLPVMNIYGDRSAVQKVKIDCKLKRIKTLSSFSYSQPMGQGVPRTSDHSEDKHWSEKIPHNSHMMTILESVCK